MAFRTITLALAADVANSGTITNIAYPAGTNQAFFTGGNASSGSVAVVNENDVYRQTASQIGVTYGASTITVTNSSGVTWPAGATLRVQLDYLQAAVVTVVEQPVIVDLGGSLTGTNNDAIADLTTLTDSPATADALRDQLMSAWKVEIDSHFKEVQAKINTILARLRAAGVIDV
jgi:hypothetical protein